MKRYCITSDLTHISYITFETQDIYNVFIRTRDHKKSLDLKKKYESLININSLTCVYIYLCTYVCMYIMYMYVCVYIQRDREGNIIN